MRTLNFQQQHWKNIIIDKCLSDFTIPHYINGYKEQFALRSFKEKKIVLSKLWKQNK